ncbi:VIT1/CCC1 transporter family protein [Rhizobium sp. 1399]|uniref:VIT1/CCC1 transporter family protein n=1 Tax=Rhizobium sp. 1399 TaxID=2817758 RepID=UPI00286462EC|nr:VIT1/CCC1 transporter family protein [Rhizobium sp. 1399]MDR6668896.1 VIT1/CCC1 family predicted Fe2+/Mn2+ transporter [Rhizobium sp. 1399]
MNISPGSIFADLDPGDALGEVLFGLIMALTWTVGSRLVLGEEGLDVRDLVVATIGCNVAWGIIDAVLFILGTTFYRSRRLRLFRQIRAARDEATALTVIAKEFPVEGSPLSAEAADAEALYRSMLALTRRAEPVKLSLTKADLRAAVAIFLLVSATALPAVIPFFLIDNADRALRASNLFLVVLLFVTGYAWAGFSGGRPFYAGMAMTCLGLFLVAIAVALGG